MGSYEKIGTDAARTPTGAIVRVLGRRGLSYATSDGVIEIDSEMLATPMTIAIYASSVRSPFVPAEAVLTELLGALDHLRFSVQIIGRLP